jgi:hypothetical protein
LARLGHCLCRVAAASPAQAWQNASLANRREAMAGHDDERKRGYAAA